MGFTGVRLLLLCLPMKRSCTRCSASWMVLLPLLAPGPRGLKGNSSSRLRGWKILCGARGGKGCPAQHQARSRELYAASVKAFHAH